MKTQRQKLPFTSRSMATWLCLAAFVFIFARTGQAQFVTSSGTNIYNFFATNVTTTTSYGTIDPDPNGPYGGDPLPSFTFQIGSPQIINGPTLITEPIGYTAFDLTDNPTGIGNVIQLNNTTSTPYEIRLDWMGTYQNNTSVAANIPTFSVIAYGNWGASSYWELAGGITVYYTGGPYTATIGSAPSLYGPAGLGPWIGSLNSSSSPSFTSPINSVTWSPSNPSIQGGDTFLVQGYLDLIVDPGSVQIQIQPGQPPGLGIGIYSNKPAVYFPTSPGTNFLVQMSTNLLTGPWVNVTNGIPLSGVIVTNAPSPAFFRLY